MNVMVITPEGQAVENWIESQSLEELTQFLAWAFPYELGYEIILWS